MKNYFYLAICLLLGMNYLHAQNRLRFIMDKEGKLFAIPTEKTYEFTIPEVTYNRYIPITEQSRLLQQKYTDLYKKYTTQIQNNLEFISFLPPAEADRPMNMQVLSVAYRPFFNPYTPMLQRVNLMALDYDELYMHSLSAQTHFWVNGVQATWSGLSGINTVDIALSQRVGNLTLTGGSFVGRYYTPYSPTPAYWGGFHALAHYDVNEWLAFKAWGSYAFYGKDNKKDPFMNINPLLNRTNVGGAMEIKIQDNFGIGFGINYQYNNIQRRMERQYLFYPVSGGSFLHRIGISGSVF